ncbi:MAG: excisionase family DNA-binding protein [Verrucomicrobiae bacterium]|nr:excisionase family DNA-binding protein [Verrucomicrobiae bacterium]
MEANQKFLSKSEIAKRLSVSLRTIDKWRDQHGMPAIQIGTVIRFDRESVDRWFNSFARQEIAQ